MTDHRVSSSVPLGHIPQCITARLPEGAYAGAVEASDAPVRSTASFQAGALHVDRPSGYCNLISSVDTSVVYQTRYLTFEDIISGKPARAS